MALMALVAVFLPVQREASVLYVMAFCVFALWLVEAETRVVRRPLVQDGPLAHVRINN